MALQTFPPAQTLAKAIQYFILNVLSSALTHAELSACVLMWIYSLFHAVFACFLWSLEIWTCLLMHFLDLKVMKVTNDFIFCSFLFTKLFPTKNLINSRNKHSELEVPHWFSWETEVIELSYRNKALLVGTRYWLAPGALLPGQLVSIRDFIKWKIIKFLKDWDLLICYGSMLGMTTFVHELTPILCWSIWAVEG